jgi:hypothetical protein
MITAVLALVMAPAAGFSQGPGDPAKRADRPRMPIYVTPYYNSDGPKIQVGEPGKALASADAGTILRVCDRLKKDRDKLRAEVMYVAAVRLYDLGKKDEAVYWFYTAQYRARVFGAILDKDKIGTIGSEAFELQQAYNAFNQLAGKYLNGYAFGRLETLEKTLQRVVEEGKAMPRYGELYPGVAFAPAETWAAKNDEVSRGLSGLITYIKTNADAIKEQRKASGVDGKY